MILSAKGSDPEWEIYFDKDIADLPIPTAPTLTASTTGGSLGKSLKYYVRYTAVNADGLESPPSIGNKTSTTGTSTFTNKITASWSAIAGASSYNVYAGLYPGREALVGNTTSTSFVITTDPIDPTATIFTLPDMWILGKQAGIDPIAFGGAGLAFTNRLIIYVTTSGSSTDVALSIVAN
jgi:hypothetical protein